MTFDHQDFFTDGERIALIIVAVVAVVCVGLILIGLGFYLRHLGVL